jgi:Asp-tRNA(Asn)/Glu-tRNA(Gln) amidotransferase C subunit
MIDLAWMKQFANAAGLEIPDEDLQAILKQLRPVKEGLERMKDVPLEGLEISLTFRPGSDRDQSA